MTSDNKIIDDWSDGDTDGKNWLGQFTIEDNSLVISSYNPTNTKQPIQDTIIALSKNTQDAQQTQAIAGLEPTDPIPVFIRANTSNFAIDNVKKEVYWVEMGRMVNHSERIWPRIYKSSLGVDDREIIHEFDIANDYPSWHYIINQPFRPSIVLDRRRNFIYAIIGVGVIIKIDLDISAGYASEVIAKSISPDDSYWLMFDFLNNLPANVNITMVPGVADQDTDITGQGKIWSTDFRTLKLDEENNKLHIFGSLIGNNAISSSNISIDLNSIDLDEPQWVVNSSSSTLPLLDTISTVRDLRYNTMRSVHWPELRTHIIPTNSLSIVDIPGMTIVRRDLNPSIQTFPTLLSPYEPDGFLSHSDFVNLAFLDRIQYITTTLVYPNVPNWFIIDDMGRTSSLISAEFQSHAYNLFINRIFIKREMALWPNSLQPELFLRRFGMADYDEKIDCIFCVDSDQRSIHSFDISKKIFANMFPHLPNFGPLLITSHIGRFNFNSNYASKTLLRNKNEVITTNIGYIDNPDNIGFTNDKMYVTIDIKEITNGSGYFEIYNGIDVVQSRTHILSGVTVIELELDEDIDRINFVIGITANIGKTGTIKINSVKFHFDEEPEIEPTPGCVQGINQTGRIIASSDWSQGQTVSFQRWNDYSIDQFSLSQRRISSTVRQTIPPLQTSIRTTVLNIGNGVDITINQSKDKIYWTEISDLPPIGYRDGIYRCNLDGTDVVTILELTPEIRPHSLVISGQHIYYTSDSAKKIMRCSINGSGLVELCTTTHTPREFIFNNQNGTIIYVASDDNNGRGGIFSCPIDGGQETTIINTNNINHQSLRYVRTIRDGNGVYLLSSLPPGATLNPTFQSPIISYSVNKSTFAFIAISRDLRSVPRRIASGPNETIISNIPNFRIELLYNPPFGRQPSWHSQNADYYQNALRLSSTNDGDGLLIKKDSIYTVGSGVILESSILPPRTINHILDIGNGLDISTDKINGYIYWTEISNSSPSSIGYRDGIYRCNADGTGFVEILELTPEIRPYGIQLYNNYIYYTSDATKKIMRCNLDGSGLIELCSAMLPPRKFIIEELDGTIIYVASEENTNSLSTLGGIYRCPIGGGVETTIAQSDQVKPNSAFLNRVRAVTRDTNLSGLSNFDRYLLASDRNKVRTIIIQEGGPGSNSIHEIYVLDLSAVINNLIPILITVYNPDNGDYSTFSFNNSNGSASYFSSLNSSTEDFKNLLVDSAYWLTENDVEITRTQFINGISIEFKGAMSNTKVQKIDVLVRVSSDNDLYYVNKSSGNTITQAGEIRSDLRMFQASDLAFNDDTNEVLVSGNGINILHEFPTDIYRERSVRDGRIRDGRIEGIDYGVTGPPAYISYMFLSDNTIPADLVKFLDFRTGEIFGISIGVKDISNCRLFVQSISDTRAPLEPANHSVFPTVFEEFELTVGINNVNFVVSQSGLLNIRIIVKSDNIGYYSAEILDIDICKSPIIEELSCHGQSVIFDHDFESIRNGWSGGILDTNRSSIVNITSNSGDDDFATMSRQLTVNRQPYGSYLLGIKLGDIVNFPNDPGFHVTQTITITINRVGSYTYVSNMESIYKYQTWSSSGGDIELTPGTYNINISIPLRQRYYLQNGITSQREPVGAHEVRYFRRKIEIDQILLCLLDPDFRRPTTINHTTNFTTFLPEAPQYFHYTDSRFIYSGRRHSTDFLSFDPGYVTASGNYIIQSHNMIGNTDVERFKEELNPKCLNNTKLNNNQWYTNKRPDNCK